MNDDDLLRAYNADHEIPQPRPSVSYDEFVGSQTRPQLAPSTSSLPGGPGSSANLDPNYSNNNISQTFSNQSGLGNYDRYGDDNSGYPDDDESLYYGAASTADGAAGLRVAKAKNRNSVLSMGGGIMGKAKNMLGLGPGYSEMDLPLTEPGSRTRADDPGLGAPKPAKKKFDLENFKFGFGGGKVDPATLGPRIIYMNNPPANATGKYVNNYVSTSKYNVATFLPKFLYEQFSKYANLFF